MTGCQKRHMACKIFQKSLEMSLNWFRPNP